MKYLIALLPFLAFAEQQGPLCPQCDTIREQTVIQPENNEPKVACYCDKEKNDRQDVLACRGKKKTPPEHELACDKCNKRNGRA
jgi:hypothetical protein